MPTTQLFTFSLQLAQQPQPPPNTPVGRGTNQNKKGQTEIEKIVPSMLHNDTLEESLIPTN